MPSCRSAPRNGQAPERSGLPEALPTFGAALGPTEADIVELAVVEGREVPARPEAVMPQREAEEQAVNGTTPAWFVREGEDAKNDLHGRAMPRRAFGNTACAEISARMKPDNNGEIQCDLERLWPPSAFAWP